MTEVILADRVRDPETRTGRALLLLDAFGEEAVEQVADEVFLVISSDGESYYRVIYGEQESCTCRDFEYHGGEEPCKHLLLVGIVTAKRRRRSFRCQGCRERFPSLECHEVGEENLTFFPGDALCGECAHAHGVL